MTTSGIDIRREHGTFRVRWDCPGDPGEYHSRVLTTRTEANAYASDIRSLGANAWIERADWVREDEWVGA